MPLDTHLRGLITIRSFCMQIRLFLSSGKLRKGESKLPILLKTYVEINKW
jgi:hypothetical protein